MDIALIPIVNRLGQLVATAIVDSTDEASVSAHTWRLRKALSGLRYVYRGAGQSQIALHHHIAGDGIQDHINGDGLDNRRLNLRAVTHAQNMQNRKKHKNGTTSPERGVSWCSRSQRWRAEVRLNGRKVFSRYSASHDVAVDAARDARRRLFTHATN